MQPLIRAAQGIGCKQTDFAIGLPHLTDMPDDRFGGGLLQAMQEREGLGTRNHDITPANIFVFETAHLGDDSPNAVICYLERGEEYFPYDIVEGSTSRRNHIQGELLEAMDDAKKVPGDNGPIVDVFEQEDDDSEDPIARTKRLHIEAMTYLAESVRSAVCEPIYEEEPRMLGPGRGISYGFESE